MSEAHIVPDVVAYWYDMDGKNDLICKLNAALALRCVGRYEIASDECVNEAEKVFALWLVSNNETWANVVQKYVSATYDTVNPSNVKLLMGDLDAILHERPWPFLIPIKGGKA